MRPSHGEACHQQVDCVYDSLYSPPFTMFMNSASCWHEFSSTRQAHGALPSPQTALILRCFPPIWSSWLSFERSLLWQCPPQCLDWCISQVQCVTHATSDDNLTQLFLVLLKLHLMCWLRWSCHASLTVPRSLSSLTETIYLESWCSSGHINYSSRNQVSRMVSKAHMLAKTCPHHKTRTYSKTTLRIAIRCFCTVIFECEGRFGWSDSRWFLRI